MKTLLKIAILAISLGIISVIYTGCQEENPGPNPVTMMATAGPNGVIEPNGQTLLMPGDTMTFKIKANTNYKIKFVKVDNVLLEGINYPAKFNYKFKASSRGLIIETEFVHDDIVLMIKSPWYEKLREIYKNDTYQYGFILTKTELDYENTFSLNDPSNKYQIFEPGNPDSLGDCYWDYISKDRTIIFFRGDEKIQAIILELTKTSFVYKEELRSYPDGTIDYCKRTFWRAE